MRILAVTHYQPPHHGGIETVAAALVGRYRQAGHEVVWLSSDLPPAAADPGCVRVPAWNVLEDRLGVPYPLWRPAARHTVRRLVEWCDAAHCHDCLYLGTLGTMRCARQSGKPVLLTQHVGPVPYRSLILRGVQRLAYATLGRAVHQRADRVVFISHTVRQWFERRVQYRHTPLFIANGVDLSMFHCADGADRGALRARLQMPADQRLLLFVGRFVEKKGIHILAALAQRFPDWHFLLIGDGPADPRAWQLGNVRVLPFQPQTVLRDYYRAADALLLPSTGEGFPLVVMEAMACGTAALVSEETFAAWNDGREFFLVSEPTVDAVAAVLERPQQLLQPEAHSRIAAYARQRWNWDQVAQQYLHLLADLAESVKSGE
jgi:glycosyltransferase involved in cell wall biosynthesis